MTTTQTMKHRAKVERPRATDGAETMLEEWVTRLEGASRPPAKGARSRAVEPKLIVPGSAEPTGVGADESARVALARVRLEGSLATIDDTIGGTVALARTGERIAHAGSVAVRGPLGVKVEELRGTPMTEAHARGAEHVAAWFGAPLDAISVAARGEGPSRVAWGFWSLGHADLARTLRDWKAADAASFDACLGVYGVDVAAPADDPLAEAKLVVVDPHRGVVRGARALAVIAGDPRRIAVLARALRHASARAAQVKTVVSWAIAPVFARVVVRGDRKVLVADLAASPRAAAAVLCAARALDLDSFARVLDADVASDDALLQHIARWLVVQGDKATAHRVRRVLASPELA